MKWLWIGLLLTIAIPAHADVLPSPEAARELAGKIMGALSKDDTDHGLALIKEHTMSVPGIDIDEANKKIKEQLASELQLFGNNLGYEVLTNKAIGSSLLRITALQRLEKHGIGWTFDFYKAASGWTLAHYGFSDKLEEMFGP